MSRALKIFVGVALAASTLSATAFAAPQARVAVTSVSHSLGISGPASDWTKKGIMYKQLLNDPDVSKAEKKEAARWIIRCSRDTACASRQSTLIAWYKNKYDGPGHYRG